MYIKWGIKIRSSTHQDFSFIHSFCGSMLQTRLATHQFVVHINHFVSITHKYLWPQDINALRYQLL